MAHRRVGYRAGMSEESAYPALYLKRNEDTRLRAGHLWVFSNEVDVKRSPLTGWTKAANKSYARFAGLAGLMPNLYGQREGAIAFG